MTVLTQTSFVPGWAIVIPLLVLAALWLWALVKAAEEPDHSERTRPLWDDLWDGYLRGEDEAP